MLRSKTVSNLAQIPAKSDQGEFRVLTASIQTIWLGISEPAALPGSNLESDVNGMQTSVELLIVSNESLFQNFSVFFP